jgi:hypothetical protein
LRRKETAAALLRGGSLNGQYGATMTPEERSEFDQRQADLAAFGKRVEGNSSSGAFATPVGTKLTGLHGDCGVIVKIVNPEDITEEDKFNRAEIILDPYRFRDGTDCSCEQVSESSEEECNQEETKPD